MSGETEAHVSGWTTDTLRAYLIQVIAEMDRRHEQRFDAEEEAVRTALASIDRRLEAVNEFRATLAAQTNTFIPRAEAEQRAAANADKIDALATRFDKLDGRSAGLSAGWVLIGQAVAILASVVAVAVVLAR